MSTTRDLGEDNRGLYQWVSTPDSDGDFVAIGNARRSGLVFHVTNKAGVRISALVSVEEVREALIAALDLLDGVRPSVGDSEESEL